jgi:hypothetical protein
MSRSVSRGSDDLGDPDASGEGASRADAPDHDSQEPSERPGPGRARVPPWLKAAVAAASVAVVAAAVFAYRTYQERRVVAASVARARQLIRSDTWLGYHEAATILALRAAKVDPLEAGSLRAYALAMLSADYRDRASAEAANAALVEPLRAADVPAIAQLAVAGVALGEGRAGTAVEYLSRAGEGALPLVLTARVAALASNAAFAAETAQRAVAAEADVPAALALNGDLLRRGGRAAEARQAYATALTASARALSAGLAGSTVRAGATAPHPRATFGLAKLALSREAPAEDATAALTRLVEDRAGSPQVERARAAMYLSALQARAGDRAAAVASLDKAGVDGDLRAWLERAAGQLEVERGAYRVPDRTPSQLLSASDDDPYVPPPPAKVEAAPAKPVIHGFKVHPNATGAKATRASTKSKKPSQKQRRRAD